MSNEAKAASPLVVTRDGISCEDQAAALEEFKQACRSRVGNKGLSELHTQITGRDLDLEIAAIIEARPSLPDACSFAPHDTLSPQRAWVHTHNTDGACRLEPRAFSFEPVLACRVEDEIGRRGLIGDYIAALWDVMGADRSINFWTQSNIEAFWSCIRATPEQRCRAALVALKQGSQT